MIDIHSHSIFGVDDGSSSIEQSIKMLKTAKSVGYDTVCFTPHYMDDGYKTSRNELLQKVEELKNAISKENVNIDLKLGEEVFIFPELADRLDEVVFMNDSKYLLFEIPLMEDITYLEDVVYKLQSKGVVPILAHPERYLKSANDFSFLENLYNKGVLLQVNVNSLIGHYGSQAEKLAKKLLENRMVCFVSTDAHSEHGYESTEESVKVLKKLVSEKYFELLTETNLKNVLNNDEVINIKEIEEPETKSFFSKFHLPKVFLFLLCFLMISNISYGATKEDVISALNTTYKVSDTQNYKLPKKYVQKGTDYLNNHELTSSQYDKILIAINKAVEFARKVGHTRRKDYTKEQLNEALSIIVEACRAAEVDLSEELENEEENNNKQSVGSPQASKEEQIKNNNTTNDINSQKEDHNNNLNNSNDNNNQDNESKNIEEISGDISGEIVPPDVDIIENDATSNSNSNNDLLSEIKENVKPKQKPSIKALINRNITIIISASFAIILLNIFLIRLIMKKKWNTIIKKCLIIILALIIISVFLALGLFIYYLEEIKLGFELYYLIK